MRVRQNRSSLEPDVALASRRGSGAAGHPASGLWSRLAELEIALSPLRFAADAWPPPGGSP